MEKGVEELLRGSRKLKKEMRAFGRTAWEFLRTRPETPEDAMDDLQTDVVGTVECLLSDDLGPALKKLDELDGLSQEGFSPEVDLNRRRLLPDRSFRLTGRRIRPAGRGADPWSEEADPRVEEADPWSEEAG